MTLFWLDHIIFLIVGIVIPLLSLFSASQTSGTQEGETVKMELPPKKHLYYSNGLMLWIGASLVLTSWNFSQKPWGLLGIQYPQFSALSWYLIAALLLIYLADTAYSTFKAIRDKTPDDEEFLSIMPANWKEYAHFVFLACSAGVCEEVVFRGFLINYIHESIPIDQYSMILSVLIPGIIFSVSHIYQGFLNVFKIFSLSLLFGSIFLLTKSLVVVIMLHIFVDMLSGAVFVILQKRKQHQ